MQNSTNSGDLIAVGADGRGGRVKVLRSACHSLVGSNNCFSVQFIFIKVFLFEGDVLFSFMVIPVALGQDTPSIMADFECGIDNRYIMYCICTTLLTAFYYYVLNW